MHYILFTTTRCPKCPQFKEEVEKSVPFSGEILDETSEKFADFIKEFGITTAPTIIIFQDDSFHEELFRSDDISELITYIEKECTLAESKN